MKLTRAVLYTGSASAAALLALPGCLHVKTDPIKVEPIHIRGLLRLRETDADPADDDHDNDPPRRPVTPMGTPP
jgi:hypothetical protein